jgi:hypothetical protein
MKVSRNYNDFHFFNQRVNSYDTPIHRQFSGEHAARRKLGIELLNIEID